jgi:HSP20 family protein
MQEQIGPQYVPVKVYRSEDRLTLAAPMPGMEPEDITVEVTADARLILDGALRGILKGVKDLLIDEWSVGGYHREVPLPATVDAALGTVTYGNGVVVVSLPLADQQRGAVLTVTSTGLPHAAPGEYEAGASTAGGGSASQSS